MFIAFVFVSFNIFDNYFYVTNKVSSFIARLLDMQYDLNNKESGIFIKRDLNNKWTLKPK